MNDHRIATRADRLRVILLALGEEPTMDLADAFAAHMVPRGWYAYMGGVGLGLQDSALADDAALAMQCSTIGRDLRAR